MTRKWTIDTSFVKQWRNIHRPSARLHNVWTWLQVYHCPPVVVDVCFAMGCIQGSFCNGLIWHSNTDVYGWAYQHSLWYIDCQKIIFLEESRSSMDYKDECLLIRRCRGERFLLECLIYRQTRWTPSVMVSSYWISYVIPPFPNLRTSTLEKLREFRRYTASATSGKYRNLK